MVTFSKEPIYQIRGIPKIVAVPKVSRASPTVKIPSSKEKGKSFTAGYSPAADIFPKKEGGGDLIVSLG